MIQQSLSRTFTFIAYSTLAALIAVGVAGCTQEVLSSNPSARAQGMKEFGEGNYADAAGSFRNAVRSDPRDYRSQFYLGQCYEQSKQWQQAIQAYKASLDAQPRTLAGQEDQAQRQRTLDALASVIAKCDQQDAETNQIEQTAKASNQPQDWLLLGKIYADRGDADSAINAYNRAFLINPKDFIVTKTFGLYLEQIGQKQRAEQTLRKAYTLNANDEQVNEALRRLNVVPGPGLKDESALVKPPLPQGPLPEVDLSKFKLGGSSDQQPQTTETPSATYTPAPAAPQQQPAAIPQPPTAANPVEQQRAVSAPRD